MAERESFDEMKNITLDITGVSLYTNVRRLTEKRVRCSQLLKELHNYRHEDRWKGGGHRFSELPAKPKR